MELAGQWKRRADRLLAQSQLLPLLTRHGRVAFSGGYAYDLMMTPNIDVHLLLSPFTRAAAAEVLGGLVQQGWWSTITFVDRVDERFRSTLLDVPRGYYIGMETDFHAAQWTVDVWLFDAAKYRGDVWRPIIDSISDEQRRAILEIKAARNEGKVTATGVEVYEAVISGGARGLDDFVGLRATRTRTRLGPTEESRRHDCDSRCCLFREDA
jgi:hypothetical protein